MIKRGWWWEQTGESFSPWVPLANLEVIFQWLHALFWWLEKSALPVAGFQMDLFTKVEELSLWWLAGGYFQVPTISCTEFVSLKNTNRMASDGNSKTSPPCMLRPMGWTRKRRTWGTDLARWSFLHRPMGQGPWEKRWSSEAEKHRWIDMNGYKNRQVLRLGKASHFYT